MSRHWEGKQSLFFTFLLTLLLSVTTINTGRAADGKELFESKCKACHHPEKNGVGPALKGVKAKWDAEESGLIYTWVRNQDDAARQSSFAAEIAASRGDVMTKFPELSDADVDAVFEYVEAWQPDAGGGAEAGGGDVTAQEDDGISYWWFVVGSILLVVIFAAAGIRRQIGQLHKANAGEDEGHDETYGEIIRGWAKRNQGTVSIIGVATLFTVILISMGWLMGIGVPSDYQPSQPVEAFSHKVHAGDNGIDCKVCHNSVTKSKHAGLPTGNVCMNCHKALEGASEEGKKSVAYVREMNGYDENEAAYTGDSKPIVWNRVYVLPDHVYFNHSQHIEVGGLECVNCHGDMTKETTARVVDVSELEPVGGNEDNKLTRPVLTMGWCIECHGNVAVNPSSNMDQDNHKVTYYEEIHRRLTKRADIYKKYRDDEKVTVSELGGWECAKCHY